MGRRLAVRDWPSFNQAIIEEFRANGGRVERFGGLPLIIVHCIGARSEQLRLTPLIPVFDGDQMMIYGTAEGSARHPDWYFNLRAHSTVDVETATETFKAEMVQLAQREANERLQEQAASTPVLAGYLESAAPREVPIFRVERRETSGSVQRPAR